VFAYGRICSFSRSSARLPLPSWPPAFAIGWTDHPLSWSLSFHCRICDARNLVLAYMIPFTITVAEAAAPHSTLAFMSLGAGLFVFPLMLLYTAISLSMFRGKIRAMADHY
jgi:cytochrome bd-type quinol oxidase subunit 2